MLCFPCLPPCGFTSLTLSFISCLIISLLFLQTASDPFAFCIRFLVHALCYLKTIFCLLLIYNDFIFFPLVCVFIDNTILTSDLLYLKLSLFVHRIAILILTFLVQFRTSSPLTNCYTNSPPGLALKCRVTW